MSDKQRDVKWVNGASFGEDIRLHDEQPFYEFVVTPEGRIKTCYYERNLSNALLHIHVRKGQGGRIIGISKVTVSEEFAQLGYVFLRELYEQEDRREDWESFLLYQVQARKRHLREPIGDDYLPDEVLRRRAAWVEEEKKVELPAPKKKRQPKKAGKKAPASIGGLRGKLKGKPAKGGAYEIQRVRFNPRHAMGTGPDFARLMDMAAQREALADGDL